MSLQALVHIAPSPIHIGLISDPINAIIACYSTSGTVYVYVETAFVSYV